MKVELQPSYVLHTRPYRETSLLVEHFTPDYGRIGLIAKGARSARSKRRAELQPFRCGLASWSRKGELGVLTQLEPANRREQPFPAAALALGFYLNELLMRFTARDDPNPELFDAYSEALQNLKSPVPASNEACLRKFEVSLLSACGYGLEWRRDYLSGGMVDPDSSYRLDIDQGFTRSSPSRKTVTGTTLLDLHRGEFTNEDSRREAKKLLSLILAHHLGGKPLKSRELFYRMKADNEH